MAKVLGLLIRYFSNYYILHRSDLAARAAPLDPRLVYITPPVIYTLQTYKRFQNIVVFSKEIVLQLSQHVFYTCYILIKAYVYSAGYYYTKS